TRTGNHFIQKPSAGEGGRMNATQPGTDEPVTTALRKALWNILHWDVESTIPVELWQAAHKAATRAELSQEERRIRAALKACEGVPTELLENSVSIMTPSESLAEVWRLRRQLNELKAKIGDKDKFFEGYREAAQAELEEAKRPKNAIHYLA